MGNKPHKHCDAICAWARGENIQFRPSADDIWRDSASPSWFDDDGCEYRVKPEPVVWHVLVEIDHEKHAEPKMTGWTTRKWSGANMLLTEFEGKITAVEILK